MANAADVAPLPGQTQAEPPARTSLRGLFGQTEIDLRLFGMLVALVVILFTFNILSGGTLIQPTNMITMAVQAAGIAIIATGMVLVIVSRNIDLSVGSLVGLIAMSYALLDDRLVPAHLRDRRGRAVPVGPGPRPRDRARRGRRCDPGVHHRLHRRAVVHRHAGRPAVDPRPRLVPIPRRRRRRDSTRRSSFSAAAPSARSARSSPGPSASVGCVAIVGLLYNSRRQRHRYGFPTRPMWAEVLVGGVGCAIVLGLAWFANNAFWPNGLAAQYAADHGITPPPGGLKIPVGFPFPIVALIGVTLVMSFIANRRRFGRYVYAYGGNPDAAELAGINTRLTILKIYVLMGVLCALAAAIAAARLNGATLDIGSATSSTSSPPRWSVGRRSRAASGRSPAPSWAPS